MSDTILDAPSNETDPAPLRASIGRWVVQAARSAVFLRPDWTGLRATPGLLAALCLAGLAVSIVLTRLYLPGHPTFRWYMLAYGWLPLLLEAWGCWLALIRLAPRTQAPSAAADAPTLLAMLWLQALVYDVVLGAVYVLVMRGVGGLHWPTGALTHLPLLAQSAWIGSTQVRLALDGSRDSAPWPRAGLVATLLLTLAMVWLMPMTYWEPDRPQRAVAKAADAATAASIAASDADTDEASDEDTGTAPDTPMLQLTQDLFEHQQQLLATQLDAIRPRRSGVVDLYAITFAPYADVDVFMRESAVVAGVMEQRFDARGRTLQLVNNIATTDRLAWATPLNLQRAIERIAQRMDRDNDILFIHLTSHGGADGHLAAEFFPLTVDELTPAMLRRWLDDAHVRHRVISISACYSGSWIAPLANEDTLVMTAADADHTSYGCGSKSTLTFFGQAMYDEQLRHTRSFEQAHAAARRLIDERERAAGKTDGYSNPQIRVGSRIRERLKALEARLAASGA
jgi:hypothetical protein